jgi:pimeloyl-ACP methyl ester carboxylesterase
VKEEAVLLGQARSLVGILTNPAREAQATHLPAVILLNAGIVHRVGPQRLYVKIARSLAAMGFVVLRFDFSGIGDSTVRHDNLPFEKSTVSETQEAMSYLEAERGIGRFVLAGLCSGADISLKTACADPRVAGAVLLNPQGDELDTGDELRSYFLLSARARSVWKSALFNPQKWWRVLTGRTDYRDVARVLLFTLRSKVARKKRVVSGPSLYAENLRLAVGRAVRLLLVFSDGDTGLDYIHAVLGAELQQLRSSGKAAFHVIPRSDHMFTSLRYQDTLLTLVREWAQTCFLHARLPVTEDSRLPPSRGAFWGGLAEQQEACVRPVREGK